MNLPRLVRGMVRSAGTTAGVGWHRYPLRQPGPLVVHRPVVLCGPMHNQRAETFNAAASLPRSLRLARHCRIELFCRAALASDRQLEGAQHPLGTLGRLIRPIRLGRLIRVVRPIRPIRPPHFRREPTFGARVHGLPWTLGPTVDSRRSSLVSQRSALGGAQPCEHSFGGQHINHEEPLACSTTFI